MPPDRELPERAPEPATEPVDQHRGPLDRDEDGRWLNPDDPRRIEAERRLGRSFDADSLDDDERHERGRE
jgi:hypothetical protein